MTVHTALLKMQERLLEKPHLLRLGCLFCATVLVQVDEQKYYLTFEKGHLATIDANPSTKIPWHFALRTDEEALNAFWQAVPEPGFHDIFGLAKIGRAEIEGDIILLVKNLRFFKEVFALARTGAEQ